MAITAPCDNKTPVFLGHLKSLASIKKKHPFLKPYMNTIEKTMSRLPWNLKISRNNPIKIQDRDIELTLFGTESVTRGKLFLGHQISSITKKKRFVVILIGPYGSTWDPLTKREIESTFNFI